jgi:hypothetical protein
MILRITYDKNTKTANIEDDISEIIGQQVSVYNPNALKETDSQIYFEVAINTTCFENKNILN